MSKSKEFDYVFKCIIIGDTGTGKSCCLHQFVEGKFRSGPPKHTIGVEFGSKILLIGEEQSVKLQIWDTAGQERFRAITRSYYREAAAALVVYDITDRDSFLHVQNWIRDARSLAGQNICIMIVGNKCDLKEKRQVPLLEASRFAQENSALFLETSALTGQNITEAFYKCAKSVLAKVQSGVIFVRDPLEDNTSKDIQIGGYTVLDDNGLCAC